jgi:hypothetical protein
MKTMGNIKAAIAGHAEVILGRTCHIASGRSVSIFSAVRSINLPPLYAPDLNPPCKQNITKRTHFGFFRDILNQQLTAKPYQTCRKNEPSLHPMLVPPHSRRANLFQPLRGYTPLISLASPKEDGLPTYGLTQFAKI